MNLEAANPSNRLPQLAIGPSVPQAAGTIQVPYLPQGQKAYGEGEVAVPNTVTAQQLAAPQSSDDKKVFDLVKGGSERFIKDYFVQGVDSGSMRSIADLVSPQVIKAVTAAQTEGSNSPATAEYMGNLIDSLSAIAMKSTNPPNLIQAALKAIETVVNAVTEQTDDPKAVEAVASMLLMKFNTGSDTYRTEQDLLITNQTKPFYGSLLNKLAQTKPAIVARTLFDNLSWVKPSHIDKNISIFDIAYRSAPDIVANELTMKLGEANGNRWGNTQLHAARAMYVLSSLKKYLQGKASNQASPAQTQLLTNIDTVINKLNETNRNSGLLSTVGNLFGQALAPVANALGLQPAVQQQNKPLVATAA